MSPEPNASRSSEESQAFTERHVFFDTAGQITEELDVPPERSVRPFLVKLGDFDIGPSPVCRITLCGYPNSSTTDILAEFEEQRGSDGSEASVVTKRLLQHLTQAKPPLGLVAAAKPDTTHPQLSKEQIVSRVAKFAGDLRTIDWTEAFIERLQSQLQETDEGNSRASYKQEFESMLKSSESLQVIGNTTGAVQVEAAP